MLGVLVDLLQGVHGLLPASSPVSGCIRSWRARGGATGVRFGAAVLVSTSTPLRLLRWSSAGLLLTGRSPWAGPHRAVPLDVSRGVAAVTLGLPVVGLVHSVLWTKCCSIRIIHVDF